MQDVNSIEAKIQRRSVKIFSKRLIDRECANSSRLAHADNTAILKTPMESLKHF